MRVNKLTWAIRDIISRHYQGGSEFCSAYWSCCGQHNLEWRKP